MFKEKEFKTIIHSVILLDIKVYLLQYSFKRAARDHICNIVPRISSFLSDCTQLPFTGRQSLCILENRVNSLPVGESDPFSFGQAIDLIYPARSLLGALKVPEGRSYPYPYILITNQSKVNIFQQREKFPRVVFFLSEEHRDRFRIPAFCFSSSFFRWTT